MRWMLVEAADRVLPEIDPKLADYAVHELRSRGMDIRLGTTLDEVGEDSIKLSTGELIPTRTVVWTAGVAPHPSLKELSVELDERGKVPVDDHMAVRGLDDVYAAGDCAAVPEPRRRASARRPPSTRSARRASPPATWPPPSAPASRTTFTYRSRGAFVNLGQYKAVASLGAKGRATLSGFPAWWAARSYHVSQIPGLARKVRTVADWTIGLPFAPRHRRGRLDRPPGSAERLGLRVRRQPPADRDSRPAWRIGPMPEGPAVWASGALALIALLPTAAALGVEAPAPLFRQRHAEIAASDEKRSPGSRRDRPICEPVLRFSASRERSASD